ncbi:MAG: hypothetical protein KF729_12645 [Sandaracinaceae bacterium]|nr:hypothetical protein [Sandaracinaceae bacterium]
MSEPRTAGATALALLALLALGASGCFTVWQGRSPDRREAISVHELIDRQFVRVGGANHPGYEAVGFTQLVTSAAGDRVAYPAQTRGRWRLVVDGREGPPWAGIGEVVMSADGRHVAYAAEDDEGRWRVVVDGHAHRAFDAIHAGTLAFAEPARGRALLRYVASDAEGARLVINGAAGPAFAGIGAVRFAERRFAYVARDGAWSRVVTRAGPSPRYDDVPEIVLAHGRLAYIAEKDRRFVLVLDGAHATAPEDELVALQVSRAGRVACVRREGEREGVWLDGVSHPLHGRVDGTTLTFSADGSRLAYVARDAGSARVVVDAEDGPAYVEIDGPAFDAAGRVVYVGRRAGGSVVHAGAHTVTHGTWAGHPVTGGERFAYLLREGERTAVVSDRGRAVFDAVIASTLTFDAAGRRWGVVAVARDAALRVAIEGGETRALDMDEVSALATRDPSVRDGWAATEAVRRWVRAELTR